MKEALSLPGLACIKRGEGPMAFTKGAWRIPGRAEDYRSERSPQPGDKRQRTEPGRPSPRVRAPGEEFERGAMKPESRSSGFAGREGCVRERTYFFVADPCIDFRIDVYEADDVALMKVIQYRRQLMRHIDKGSEVQHDVRPSF